MQVDVFELPNYELSQAQQEWLWLFSLVVAGKSAEFATAKVNAFLEPDLKWARVLRVVPSTPFHYVLRCVREGQLNLRLKAAKTGNYTKLDQAFRYSVAHLKVHSPLLTIRDLEDCPGCGPKTSRFFYMMTRPGARCAALDIHVLRFLRDCGYEGVPKNTPAKGPVYERLEGFFLLECDKRSKCPADFDIEVWKAYREGRAVS